MHKVFTNPETGEQIQILKSAEDTQGAYVEFDNFIPADMAGPPKHMHPSQTEQFEVIEGTLNAWVAGQWQQLGTGKQLHVNPGVFHTFDNQGLPKLHIRVRLSPALDAEQLYKGLMNLRVQQSKLKALLRLSWLLTHVKSYFYFRGPKRLQRGLFALLGKVAHILKLHVALDGVSALDRPIDR